MEVEQNDVSKNINDPEASTISIINVGYVNNAFEVGPKTTEDKVNDKHNVCIEEIKIKIILIEVELMPNSLID